MEQRWGRCGEAENASKFRVNAYGKLTEDGGRWRIGQVYHTLATLTLGYSPDTNLLTDPGTIRSC
jgi:hypothetical protein